MITVGSLWPTLACVKHQDVGLTDHSGQLVFLLHKIRYFVNCRVSKSSPYVILFNMYESLAFLEVAFNEINLNYIPQ